MSEIINSPIIVDGSDDAETLLILAHGAGAPMDTDFMNFFAEKLAKFNICVLRFEFPYMALRREGHGRRPPNTQKVLMTSWRNIIEKYKRVHTGKIYIGGKSMGGRMASMVADECSVQGVVCLGYPFYAPGKQDKPRTEHLIGLETPTLIIQGERDPMGTKEVVGGYALSEKINISWMFDGNHDLRPRIRSGATHEENLTHAARGILNFLRK